MLEKARPRASRGIGDARDVSCRIQPRAAFVHHAAEINVGADFRAQFTLRNDAQLVMEFALSKRCGFLVAIEMRLLAGYFEVATTGEIAVDLFFVDDLLDAINGVERSGAHLAHGFDAVAPDERGRGKLHSGKDHSAVARTRSPAERFGFEHSDFDAAFRKCARRGKSAVARADDRNVCAVWQLVRRCHGRRSYRFEPVVFSFDRHDEMQ